MNERRVVDGAEARLSRKRLFAAAWRGVVWTCRGGSLAFADPESGVAFAYVMNKMDQNLAGDPRTLGLIEAVKASN